ncbi:hypothetical protein [Pseudomonas sp. LRF_L74]|uniref:hypothetical protein n=1 Tax=Pseudomonas sp. LRF_L74 TaxID=3369422 RepID=UPI003F5F8166
MKQGSAFAITVALACASFQASAADAIGQRYIDQLVQGGPASVSQAAQGMFHTNYRDQEVLDVAAEVLAQRYRTAAGNSEADAYAWVCKALAASGNGRYKNLLTQVGESDNRKLTRHCSKAAKSLSAGGSTFVPGSVNLAHYRATGGNSTGGASTSYAPTPAQALTGYGAPAQQAQAGKPTGSFRDVAIGMSMDQVNAILGAPSGTFAHQTGKAWIPFNFQGKDVARVVNLYKGQGRVIFSQASVYSSVWRVLEVQQNPNETGYP